MKRPDTPAFSTPAGELVLDVRGLTKRYGDAVAVGGIDLQIGRGEVLGLLGPNGAGKTSTVEMLIGFRERDAGEVSVLGFDPGNRAQLRKLRRRIGVVLQQTGHYRFLTVRETLAMHHSYYADPRPVDDVLALVGLTEGQHKGVRELSGGQQRRLDVGVALVGRPELIFLDEPTTGFDPAARRAAWEFIGALRDLGTSVLLTTHYMEEAQVLADRLVVLRRGEVVGAGTPAELAAQLKLETTISFTLPGGVSPAQLPTSIAGWASNGDAAGEGARIERPSSDPTRVLAELCGWAVERDVQLHDLQVRAPSLEESYLALTAATADEVAAP